MEPVSTFFTSAKIAYDIAKGISSLKTEVERNQAIAELLRTLISVQHDTLSLYEKYQSVLQEKDDLTKKVMEIEDWSETESQYELKELAPGVPVYAYKKTDETTQPMHLLCANCFSKKQKGLYVQSEIAFSGTHYKCLNCDKEVVDYSHKKHNPANNWRGMGSPI